ncbi:MAG: alpha/beta fold hydrolase [Pirellulaceae bacterium]|nr:alpha/beta fold hydrolase [Pirellulaceae bacterium]
MLDAVGQPFLSIARRATRTCIWLVIAGALLDFTGCATQKFLIKRDTPANPLAIQLQLASKKGPQVSPRTETLLRKYDLLELYQTDTPGCMERLQQLTVTEPTGELVYSVAELAYLEGHRAEKDKDEARALDMFGVAVSNAYMYLFASEFDPIRNPYDPQFRGACDLYNTSLEATLRLVNIKGQLRPGESYTVTTGKQTYEVNTVAKGKWRNEDFERFEFVSEFKLSEKLDLTGTTYGLGVPLIAVRRQNSADDPREKYYPEGLSFPVTALLRVVSHRPGERKAVNRHSCVLELHDPLAASDIQLAQRLVPLQTDLSTALAFFLDSPQFQENTSATKGLFDPAANQDNRGIYMLEPFDPNRIPVLMVHGLWSNPVTWMPMFNDLRSFTELRKNYQFWFYYYPSGQPFWLSATQLRDDLAELRQRLDHDHRYPALDQMVLVGHSMGGLVSRMQTIESGQEFWRIMSDKPFEEVRGKPEVIEQLSRELFFHPNESIKRVVTIGTPHRGSSYSNDTTRWLGRKFIKLPTMMVSTSRTLVSDNPGVFRTTELLTASTAIDSLSPDSPVFPAMLRAPRAPWVTYHNIIGQVPDRGLFSDGTSTSDGVVDVTRAHMDDVVSEVVVAADHQNIHNTPRAILEVRRILLEHLESLRSQSRVAERLDGTQPQRISNSESMTNVPMVQISTHDKRVMPAQIGPAAAGLTTAAPQPGLPDSWWLPRWLGAGNSYSGTSPTSSQQSMQDLVGGAAQPASPKPERSVPWLKPTQLGTGSSRRSTTVSSLPDGN